MHASRFADEGLREMIERNIARSAEAARHVSAGVRAAFEGHNT
jgi:hypothetical protein